MTTIIEDGASTAQIRGAIDRWSRAMAAKDARGVNGCLTADYVLASMAPPLRTIGPDAAGLQAWFDTWRGPIGYEITDLAIAAAEDVAFSHSLNRLSGTKLDGEVVELWFRQTLGLRKVGGDWMTMGSSKITLLPFYFYNLLCAPSLTEKLILTSYLNSATRIVEHRKPTLKNLLRATTDRNTSFNSNKCSTSTTIMLC